MDESKPKPTPNTTALAIGHRIRQVRQDAGLTQTAFGRAVGVSLPTVTRIETGYRFPDAALLINVSKKYGADLNWLIVGEAARAQQGGSNRGGDQAGLIPLYKRLAQDLSNLPDEAIEEFLALPDFSPHCVACRCADDGCAPLVSSGNIVIFAPGSCEIGDLVAICDRWGSGLVRKKQILDGQVVYVADHSGFARLEDSDVTCLGKVQGTVKKM